jgi:diguanylate cyclase (GGDEF)-like protein
VVQQRAKKGPIGIVLIVTIAMVAILGLTLPNVALPRLALLGPITLFLAVVAGLSTATILLVTWRSSSARSSTLVLALAFAANAVLIFCAMLVLPLMPGVPPIVKAPVQSNIWLYVLWHAAISVGALIYVAVRRREGGGAASRRFTIGASAIAIFVVGGAATAALAFGDSLPMLAAGVTRGFVTTGVGPLTAALSGVAALLVFRVREPSSIDRALAIELIAFMLDTILLCIGSHRFTSLFYAGKVLLFLGTWFVLVAAVETLVSSRVKLAKVEWRLAKVELESARRAGRIRAVWKIASHMAIKDAEGFTSVLAIATDALRPGIPMLGLLSHRDGDTIVVDAAAWTGSASVSPSSGTIAPGTVLPFERTLQSLLSEAGKTMAWDDLSFIRGHGMVSERIGWKSFIGTPVVISRRTHFVTFATQESTIDRPFAEDDKAYVDVVASFFASRFTEQQQFERIQFQIEHDALTGLENRVQFRKAVREEIRISAPFAIALVDLDGFRHVNEQSGHQMGDEVLVEVASGLASIAPNNLVARMSADEFAVLLRGSEVTRGAPADLKPYNDLFLSPFHTGDRTGTEILRIGASIGAARFPENGRSVEDLMRRANVALDVAKAQGGSTTLMFDRPMEAILEETHLRYVELTNALAKDQLALEYQPTFDLATRRIVGAEALVRWDHPERGRLPPSEFVDFAERNSLMGPLSRWVFQRVIRDLSDAVLPDGLRVYFNLAAQMLDDIPFITELSETLRSNEKLVQHIGIEVTETAAMQNVERSMHTIELFRHWGMTVAIDDFGTGYSSLAYLKQLTVDMIKLDRSFVMGLPEDERDCALADMLLQITSRFGFATLAEGIETEAQASWLLQHGCRFGQGYLISKPRPFGELLDRLGVLHAA